MNDGYVHGYGERESTRLRDQAATLTELLHGDTRYPPGSEVLEAGCGVGAQTEILARNSPGARFVCVDISDSSLAEARKRVRSSAPANVTFARADLFDLPFPPASFDHVFVCFVLEHLREPARALASLRRCLRPGGTLTVIEGDHGSTLFHPDCAEARRAIELLVALQAEHGGDATVGRRLRPLLADAGFEEATVSPRLVYVDGTRPSWAEGFTRNTFTAMVEGVREPVLRRGLMRSEEWRAAIDGLLRTTAPDGVFCYTFFKAVAVR